MSFTPEVLLAIAGINSIIGLLALFGYLYAYIKLQALNKVKADSVRGAVEGDDIFAADQVLAILEKFTTNEARLAALKELARVQHKSQTSAEIVYTKVKDAVDLADFKQVQVKQIRRLARGVAPVFLALAVISSAYGFVTNPDILTLGTEMLSGSRVQTFRLADIVGKDGNGNSVSNVSGITVTVTGNRKAGSAQAFVKYGYYNGSGTWRGSQDLVLTFYGADHAPLAQLKVPLDRGKCVYGGPEDRSYKADLGAISAPIKSVEGIVTRVTGIQTAC